MTTPQSQCTNLELSKKLNELGYPQESLFWHEINNMDGGIPTGEVIYSADGIKPIFYSYGYISAPTVAELDSNLPYNVERPHKTKEGWVHALFSRPVERMPDAWAEVIAYLLENKLIEL